MKKCNMKTNIDNKTFKKEDNNSKYIDVFLKEKRFRRLPVDLGHTGGASGVPKLPHLGKF